MSYLKQPDGPAKRIGTTNRFLIEIEVPTCKKCGSLLVLSECKDYRVFSWLKPAVMQQLEKAGVKVQTAIAPMNGGPICTECAGDKSVYECYCCSRKIKEEEIQESFGWPQEHLCKHCYETVPAKTWDELVNELRESHQYDFNA